MEVPENRGVFPYIQHFGLFAVGRLHLLFLFFGVFHLRVIVFPDLLSWALFVSAGGCVCVCVCVCVYVCLYVCVSMVCVCVTRTQTRF